MTTSEKSLILEIILKAINAMIEWGAKQLGEDTATVRGRVIATLAKPATDETDAVAAEIADAVDSHR